MNNKHIPLIVFMIIAGTLFNACQQKKSHNIISIPKDAVPLPKALFITTGINFNQEDPALPSAIVLAIQELGKNGIPVKLEDRDILFNKKKLSKYQILILLTSNYIHDADRKFSLTYMKNAELNAIRQFVEEGGFLISGDNVGRNTYDGDDRILENGELNPKNYVLSEVYGMIFKELNMKKYHVTGLKKTFKGEKKTEYNDDIWVATGVKAISNKLDTLAVWQNGQKTYPAITCNNYGNGMSYLIASSDWLVPVNDGGEASVSQIEMFYAQVAHDYYRQKALPIKQNIWPNGYDAAFAVSFNAGDTLPSYKFVIDKLQQQINPTFFINGTIKEDIRKYLKKQQVDLASSGYLYANYSVLDFADATQDILQNEVVWQEKFKGFRFPFTTPNYKGMQALSNNDYSYDSSIVANNIDFVHGSVIPYNLVLSSDDFYKTTNILEIAPTYHDDYFFIGKLKTNEYKTPQQLQDDILRYRQYLQDYWKYAVKPNKGLMLVLAHPDLTGHSTQTFSALQGIIDTVKKQNVWISNLSGIEDYYKNNFLVSVFVKNDNKRTELYIKTENDASIKDYAIQLTYKPTNVSASIGNAGIKEIDNRYFVVFKAINGQLITIRK